MKIQIGRMSRSEFKCWLNSRGIEPDIDTLKTVPEQGQPPKTVYNDGKESMIDARKTQIPTQTSSFTHLVPSEISVYYNSYEFADSHIRELFWLELAKSSLRIEKRK